jgi:hypothetical protein
MCLVTERQNGVDYEIKLTLDVLLLCLEATCSAFCIEGINLALFLGYGNFKFDKLNPKNGVCHLLEDLAKFWDQFWINGQARSKTKISSSSK